MLRRVIVSTLIEPEIPIISESELDVSLLRSAHQARLNEQKGMKDSLAFFVFCQSNEQDIVTAIKQYAFPDIQIIINKVSESELDDYDFKNFIDAEISTWVEKNHPAALTYLCNDEYKNLNIWWAGIEATDKDTWYKELINDQYAHALPASHKKKAWTWLAILSEILEIKEPSWKDENQFLLYAATLCEWLHGFEAASGNGYSDFDAIGVYHALPLDEFYLGFLLGKSAPDEELQEIMENNELGDNSEVRGYIIKQATSDERSTLRDMLSSYFGSDVALFWALHHAIWPKYNEPSADLCNELVNPSSFEDVSEVSDAWEFVTTGWTDSADE